MNKVKTFMIYLLKLNCSKEYAHMCKTFNQFMQF